MADLESTVVALAPRLLRYCLGLVGDLVLAEEASQEALTSLVQRWRRHGPPESAVAFAFAVARRRAQRAAVRRRLLEPLRNLLDGQRPLPGPPSPAEEAERRAELARTLAAIRRLPRRDREALLLVAAGELDLAEAAPLLSISRSALKMRLHRARRRLRQNLEVAP